MYLPYRALYVLGLLFVLCISLPSSAAPEAGWSTTRITGPEQHHRRGEGAYPFRDYADWIMKELDLQPGDVVADIGAGDGWWTEHFAKAVGPTGTVHAAEVKDDLVAKLKERFVDLPQVKPYVCPFDSTGLSEDSCDLVFFAQVFHHVEASQQVAYLDSLRKTIKPLGRLVLIERYLETVSGGPGHGTQLSELIDTAEQGGWALLRYELMPGTYHYLAIFGQKDLFPKEQERRNNTNRPQERAAEAPVPATVPAMEIQPASRFATNSPFDKSETASVTNVDKTLYAKSYLWQPAPTFEVEQWIGPKPEMDGKFLLVEFWATWCPPCRRSIPVLNGIHEKYKDRILVIGVSDEEADTIAKFDNPSIAYYSAIDTRARMKEAYGVYGIPHAVIIEPGGAVIWEGFPLAEGHELTEQVVGKILDAGGQGKS